MAGVPQPENDRTSSFRNRIYSNFSLRNNVYCVPVDESEEQRQDEIKRIFREVLSNRVVLAPNFPPRGVDEPQVLDCGVGKGLWVDDLLEEYGDCEVTGIDIYFGQGDEDEDEDEDEDGDSDEDGVQEFIKHRWNLNAPFSDNRTSSRLRPESFDLINSRLLADGINEGRWQSYISNLKALLKPGGWLQMVELDLSFQSDSGRLRYDDTEPLFLWKRWYDYAMTQMGRNPRVGRQLEQLMMNAGFEAVWHQRLRLEIGRWNQSWSFQANIDPGLA